MCVKDVKHLLKATKSQLQLCGAAAQQMVQSPI